MQSFRPHRMVPQPHGGSQAVPALKQAPCGPVQHSCEPPASLLVLFDQLPTGGNLRFPVPNLDGGCHSTSSIPSDIPLLEKTLIHIREDKAEEVIVIIPSWLTRSWYHLLLQMACKIPLLLPHRRDLLSQCLPDKGTLFHTDLMALKLKVWKPSGMPSRTKAFHAIRTVLAAT